MSGKKHSGGQPAFSRLSTYLKDLKKHWYKKYTARRNRRKVRQAIDIENHQDKRLDPWSLD